MIGNFYDVSEISQTKFADCPLGKKLSMRTFDVAPVEYDKSLAGTYSAKDVEGNKNYYDDNKSLYRINDDLLPNCSYEIKGYLYQTDEIGRIISAKGQLHLKQHEGRLSIKDSIEVIGKGDELSTDDRGHLIGDQFGGSSDLGNLIPQDADVNRQTFKNFENELAKKIKEGNTVLCEIEPIYEGNSRRPELLIVNYSINGEKNMRIFPNGG